MRVDGVHQGLGVCLALLFGGKQRWLESVPAWKVRNILQNSHFCMSEDVMSNEGAEDSDVCVSTDVLRVAAVGCCS